MKTFDYDLIDDNGVCSLELPVKMTVGSIFVCEYGTYKVTESPDEVKDVYDRIPCDRISKTTTEPL